ncbi:MAG: glycosyltransferase [Chitinophagaceae bacterium]|nr:MAG: glycosyltransferase [Chitinophagaceae bacterium]
MKYWILTTEYPPLFGGGISTYCYEASRMHADFGDEVTVFIPDDKVADYESKTDAGIRVITFNSNRSKLANHMGYVPRLSFEFAAILKHIIDVEGKPDFIEAQEYLAIAYYTLQFKLLKYSSFEGIPVILVLHSPAFLYLYYNREGIYEFPNYWTGELEISCIRAADHLVAPSQYIVDEIKKHISLDGVNVTVIRNPFHFQKTDTSHLPGTSPGITEIKRDRIVFYGKLSPQKGVFEMFQYFKRLWDEGETHLLNVVGGTEKVYYPEMKTMGQLIEDRYATYIRKGLVKFTGKVSPSEKDRILADAHVVLIPSLNDNLPYAAIEAMGLGKVILASVQGGQSELLTNDINGFLFDHEQPDTFADQLKLILSLGNNRLNEIGAAAARSIRDQLAYDRIYQIKSQLLAGLKSEQKGRFFPYTRPLAVPDRIVPMTHANGLLSVVIPYYNMGDYIDACVASVLECSYSNIEIIIVDDGSTEVAGKSELDKWRKHSRVVVETKPNAGLAHTRNYGASKAKGSFLAFLDADDTVAPDYYSKALKVLYEYDNVSFVGCWVQFFGTKSDIWPTWNPEPPYILLHNTMNSSALVYKKAAFIDAGINDKKVDYGLEDYGSIISLLNSGYRGVVLPETLFNYRIRPDSMYRSLTRYKAMYSHQYLAATYPSLYQHYATDIFSLMNANGPSFAYDNPSFGMRVTSTVIGNSGMINNLKMFVKRNPALKKVLLQAKAMMKL